MRNVAMDLGFDSKDEEQDEDSHERLEHAARAKFINATRQSIQSNIQAEGLPDQYVCIVPNLTLLSVARDSVSEKREKKIIDEYRLLQDSLSDARKCRGTHPIPSSIPMSHGL